MTHETFAHILTAIEQGQSADLPLELDAQRWVRRFSPPERLILLGGGHVSQAVAELGDFVGFQVAVADDRPDFANSDRFPKAKTILCDSFEAAITRLELRRSDYVCVLTRGHRWDRACLQTILRGTQPAYLGMIGSKKRVKGLISELLDEGYDPAALAALHSPIGLSIGAVTPREIAVAICAELIAHRRSLGRDDTVLAETAADVGVLAFLADAALPKALLVVLSATGSTPAKAGAVMVTDKLGNCRGTIGGGCAEAAALGQARRIIGTGSRKLLRVDLTAEDAAKEGMVCGGEMVVFVADVG